MRTETAGDSDFLHRLRSSLSVMEIWLLFELEILDDDRVKWIFDGGPEIVIWTVTLISDDRSWTTSNSVQNTKRPEGI